MTNFLIGLLIGAIIMDTLWAWKLGIAERFLQQVQLKYKLWKARSL